MNGPAIEAKDQLNALINSGSCQCVEPRNSSRRTRTSKSAQEQTESIFTVSSGLEDVPVGTSFDSGIGWQL